MVEALKKAGVTEVKLTVYPDVQHNSWVNAYNDPELYKWFLAHERRRQPSDLKFVADIAGTEDAGGEADKARQSDECAVEIVDQQIRARLRSDEKQRH